jgi:hypothetical protein
MSRRNLRDEFFEHSSLDSSDSDLNEYRRTLQTKDLVIPSPVVPASPELGGTMKAASPSPIGDQEFDGDDVPDLADSGGSEDEAVVLRYSNSVRTAQVEQRRRARRQIAESDDEEQSIDQPVQKKAVRKLVLDKPKKVAAQEFDPAGTESEEIEEEDEDEEQTPSRPLKVPRIPWRVVKEWDNSKFTPEQIQAELEKIMKKSLADSGFTSDHVETRLPTDLGYFKEKRVSQSQVFFC